MSKSMQGVLIGMVLAAALGFIVVADLSPLLDLLVTAAVLLPSVFAIRYWNNRLPPRRG